MADAVPTLPSAVSDDVDANTDVSLTTAPSEPEEEQTNSVIGVLRVAYGDGYHRKMLWFNGDDGALLQPEDVQFTPTIRITNRRQPPPEVQPTEKKNQQIEEDEKEDTVDTMQQKQQQQQQQQRKLTSFDEVIVPGLYTLTLSSCEATNADNEDSDAPTATPTSNIDEETELHWWVKDIPSPLTTSNSSKQQQYQHIHVADPSSGVEVIVSKGNCVIEYERYSPGLCRRSRKFFMRLWRQQSHVEAQNANEVRDKIHSVWAEREKAKKNSSPGSTGGIRSLTIDSTLGNGASGLLTFADALGLDRLIATATFTVEVEAATTSKSSPRAKSPRGRSSFPMNHTGSRTKSPKHKQTTENTATLSNASTATATDTTHASISSTTTTTAPSLSGVRSTDDSKAGQQMREAGAANWMENDPFFKALNDGLNNLSVEEKMAQMHDMTERALNAANTGRMLLEATEARHALALKEMEAQHAVAYKRFTETSRLAMERILTTQIDEAMQQQREKIQTETSALIRDAVRKERQSHHQEEMQRQTRHRGMVARIRQLMATERLNSRRAIDRLQARVAALETQLRDAGIEPQDSPDISTESTTTTTSNKTPNVNSTMENRPAVSLDLSRRRPAGGRVRLTVNVDRGNNESETTTTADASTPLTQLLRTEFNTKANNNGDNDDGNNNSSDDVD